MDEQGSMINGAQVKMTGVDTGVSLTSITNADGFYTITNLPIGAYRLHASFPGFQAYVQTGILLRVDDHVEISIRMKVGQVTEVVEVHANASMLQTQQNRLWCKFG